MHLFAGCGGGILADLILGHRPVVAVEWDKYCCEILRARVADGWFDGMSVWEGDIRLFDPSEYKGRVDCIHAGFPCQDISQAGSQRGVGEDTRSGLYRQVLRIADEVQPKYLFLENVSAIVSGDNGGMLRTVVGDLATRGYDSVWRCLSAAEVGANHKRDRWWLFAYPNCESKSNESINGEKLGMVADSNSAHRPGTRVSGGISEEQLLDSRCDPSRSHARQNGDVADSECKRQSESRKSQYTKCSKESQKRKADHIINDGNDSANVADSVSTHSKGEWVSIGTQQKRLINRKYGWWEVEPNVGRVANGMASVSHRLKALGNGQVPLQCATAFSILWEEHLIIRRKTYENTLP
jgi:DNA (cytosine-5)-methyltransferase 1